jgi:hypothetical protein
VSETDNVISPVVNASNMFLFWCPGCESAHYIDKRWTFNGDMVKPTIRASVLVSECKTDEGIIVAPRCHLFVTDGQIRYLADCEHALAGQTVDMVPWSADLQSRKSDET